MTNSVNDKKNMKFWEELCGTHMAKKLGITELNSESLARFDNWYFDFYPYLDTHKL